MLNDRFQRSLRCCHPSASLVPLPPRLTFRFDPCSFCKRPLPGTLSPSGRFRPSADRRFVLADDRDPPTSPSRDLRRSRHAIATPQSLATGTRPVNVAARWPLLLPAMRFLRVAPTPLHGPFTGLTPFLSNGVQDPPVLRVTLADATIFASDRALRVPAGCLSWDFQRSPFRRSLPKSPLLRRHCCRRFGMYGAAVHPRSIFAVSHRPDGFRLFDPAHLLQRAADHGVRGVLAVCETAAPPRGPALRSFLPVPSSSPPLSW